MASWTVLTRDVAGDTPVRAAERVVFVRERFSWAALFFAPLVLLRYRLWLVFAAYVAVAVILAVAEHRFGLDDMVTGAVSLGFHVLVALELPALRIRKLRWRGYEEAGVVVARDEMEAEWRFFADWTPPTGASGHASAPPSAGRRTPARPGPVIGSLPEPYAS
ncbi:DUF2628 domain-containing protein [Azorhizobium doebereinerae]|uniref:DUF2628 domain-containing protein n=1 Tax=Azorhizobium doebereinerae TaxID=281091 RepID=UPI000412EDDE|nr:DUF2628 domain-containing protein [Azorhizobium doebereinerae]